MEGFLTRGWELILPRCSGISAVARGATLAARWLHDKPHPNRNHPKGLGCPHPARGGIDPGDLLLLPQGFFKVWKGF